MGYCINRSTCLKPFIHIAIMKRRSPMFAFSIARRNLEITEAVRYLGCIPGFPHIPKRGF
ncbi:Uncharacterised protein [Segatella copri]|nr:Uncharacterised protein [Segatella copri]